MNISIADIQETTGGWKDHTLGPQYGEIVGSNELAIISEWPENVNLIKPSWLQYLIIGMSVLNLSIVAFTVIFQIRNPKSM